MSQFRLRWKLFGGHAPAVFVSSTRKSMCSRDNCAQQMLREYGMHGGLLTADDLATYWADCFADLGWSLHSAIARREVISFTWQGVIYVPMFQFAAKTLRLSDPTTQLLDELAPVFDGWELADWFAQPSLWLAGASPVSVLPRDLPAVLTAARADRLVALG